MFERERREADIAAIDDTTGRFPHPTEALRNFIRLQEAGNCANAYSSCVKVKVGSAIYRDGQLLGLGANRTIPGNCKGLDLCQTDGHCVSTIHSEIDAIANASFNGSMNGATIYVTRYPCEACARAIVAAGIIEVVYGRARPISATVEAIFKEYGVKVTHAWYYEEADSQ